VTADRFAALVRLKYPEHSGHNVAYEGPWKNGMDSGRCSCGIPFLVGYDPTLNWGGGTGCNIIAALHPDHVSRKPLIGVPLGMLTEMAREGL